jgi:putative transposase
VDRGRPARIGMPLLLHRHRRFGSGFEFRLRARDPSQGGTSMWRNSKQQDGGGTVRPKGEHCRGYLPHCDHPGRNQFITFSLATARAALAARVVLRKAASNTRGTPSNAWREEHSLDLTRSPAVPLVIQAAIRHFDGARYTLHAWCVMPDHVHVVSTIHSGESLGRIVHSWKSFTAKRVNSILGRRGRLWQPDYYDRLLRRGMLQRAVDYVEMNPVHAGLVTSASDWPYSSAAWRLRVAGSCGGDSEMPRS